MARLRKVRSADGALAPYSEARVARSIFEASRACGAEDAVLADELAGVVTLFLEKSFDDLHPPAPADIRDMVRRVLLETGHLKIAQSYWELRGHIVPAEAHGPVHPVTIEVLSRTANTREAWDRTRLETFVGETLEMDANSAADVAASVETRLAGAGFSRVTTTLIRELVDIELALRGVEGALQKPRQYSVATRRLEEILIHGRDRSLDAETQIAREVFAPYVLHEVFSRPVSLAHQEGRLRIVDPGAPHRVPRVVLDATGPSFRGVGDLDELLIHLLMVLQAVRPLVGDHVLVRRFGDAVAGLRRPPSRTRIRAFVEGLMDHILRLDVFGRSLFPKLILEVRLNTELLDVGLVDEASPVPALGLALLDALRERRRLQGRMGLSFVLNGADSGRRFDSRLLEQVLTALRRQSDVSLELDRVPGAGSGEGNDGQRNRNQVLLDVGAVVLNLPLVLAHHGSEAAADPRAALEPALHLASEALNERYWFLRRTSPQSLRGILEFLPGGEDLLLDSALQGGQVLLWGLPYALHMLAPGGDAASRVNVLHKLLSCIDFLAGNLAETSPLQLSLGGISDRRLRSDVLRLTTQRALSQSLENLGAALASVPAGAPVFPLESPLLSAVNGPILGARFLDRLGRGLPLPMRGGDETAGAHWLQHLLAKTRLRCVEIEESSHPFEHQAELF